MSSVRNIVYPPQFYSGLRALYQEGLARRGDPANIWYSLQRLYQSAAAHPQLKTVFEGHGLPQAIDLVSFDSVTEVLHDLLKGSPRVRRGSLPLVEGSFWPEPERLRSFVPYDLAKDIVSLEDVEGANADLMGEKAMGLSRLMKLGFPVPPGVVLTTRLVRRFNERPETRRLMGESLKAVTRQIELMGEREGFVFGDWDNPLLLAVRSGAQVVTEGLLPTLQFVGLNHHTVEGLAKRFKDPVTAYRLYLRHIITLGTIVYGIPEAIFATLDLASDSVSILKKQIRRAKMSFFYHCGRSFPEDPWEQLQTALLTVSESCRRGLARDYSSNYLSSKPLRTAIIIQRQIFGVFGRNSGAAIVFSRDKRSGVSTLSGSVKFMATGDEVMTGSSQAPRPVRDLALLMPEVYRAIKETIRRAEREFRRPIKFEIAIQEGKVWITQIGSYHLWAQGTLRSAVEMVNEGIVTIPEMKTWNRNNEIRDALASSRYEPANVESLVLKGNVRVPGIGSGEIVFDLRRALKKKPKSKYIFVIDQINPLAWEAVFQRAQGIILLCDPGSHFFERAAQVRVKGRQTGIPILTHIDLILPERGVGQSQGIKESLRARLKEGTRVWLEATRDEGFLMDQRPTRKVGSVARFVRGEINADQVATRGARETVDLILRYNTLVENLWKSYGSTKANPVTIAQRLLDRGALSFELLREAILESQWGKEIAPPADLLVRHDGEGTPSAQDFIYHLEAQKVAPFVQRLWEGDSQSPKRLAKVFVHADEMQHAFMIVLFRHLSQGVKVECLEGLRVAAKEMNIRPGRGVGIYLVPRFLSVLSEETQEGARTLKDLSPEALGFIVENLFQFYSVLRKTGNLSQLDLVNRNETVGVALRYPLLDQEEKVIRFLQSQTEDTSLENVLRGSRINSAARAWLGKYIHSELVPETQEVRPPVFEESLFRSQAPSQTPQRTVEEMVTYTLSFTPRPPSLASLRNLMEERQWIQSRSSRQRQEEIFTFLEGGQQFARLLFESDPAWIAFLMIETDYAQHSFSLSYFEALSRDQQSQLLNRMVEVAREKRYSPGVPCGIFMLSRLIAVLSLDAASSLGVLQNLRPETLRFIIEDYFIFSSLRPARGIGPVGQATDDESAEGEMREAFEELTRRRNPVPSIQVTPFEKSQAEAGLREYIAETYQRYDGLEPRRWISFVRRLEPRVLGDLEGGLLSGVKLWLRKMFVSIP